MIPQTSKEASGLSRPDPDEVRTELQNILESPAFVRSERQSRFLRFICETALKGDGAKLNEYVIAHDVFERGADYSPVEDSVVRRQAHSLRQKLHDYYEAEGKNSPVRIDLPVGRYVPVFVRTNQSPPQTAPFTKVIESETPRTAKPSRWQNPFVIGTVALGLLTLGWLMGSLRQSHASPSIDPAVAEIWGPWLSDPTGAVICFSNPMTAVVKQFSFSLPASPHDDPPRIPIAAEQAGPLREYFGLPQGGNFYIYPAKSQSKMGEALGSATLTVMLTRAGVPVSATQSRFLSWENFRTQNLILLGHDEANRWLDPILDKLPIRMATTDEEKARRIIDTTAPKDRAVEFYLEKPTGLAKVSRDYALVSMIGGVDQSHQLLLINGLNTEGTQSAMEYLCNPKTARELLTQLRHIAPEHKGAWRFQLVLRTEVRDQVPTRVDLLIVKVL